MFILASWCGRNDGIQSQHFVKIVTQHFCFSCNVVYSNWYPSFSFVCLFPPMSTSTSTCCTYTYGNCDYIIVAWCVRACFTCKLIESTLLHVQYIFMGNDDYNFFLFFHRNLHVSKIADPLDGPSTVTIDPIRPRHPPRLFCMWWAGALPFTRAPGVWCRSNEFCQLIHFNSLCNDHFSMERVSIHVWWIFRQFLPATWWMDFRAVPSGKRFLLLS